jgi:tetratricopeptide (TPR) repeat protein
LEDESDQAWALNALANSYGGLGQSRKAVRLLKVYIAIREEQDIKEWLAVGLGNIALNQIRIGELDYAESNIKRRIKISRENYLLVKGSLKSQKRNLQLLLNHSRNWIKFQCNALFGQIAPSVIFSCPTLKKL